MGSLIAGIVFFAAGSAGIFFVSRRQFYRRNAAGIEEFSGYSGMLGTRLLEKLLKIASWIALVLGAVLMFVGYRLATT